MGQRYGMLPSQVIRQATTFDLVIMDISMTLENHNQKSREEGYVPEVNMEDLIKIKEQA